MEWGPIILFGSAIWIGLIAIAFGIGRRKCGSLDTGDLVLLLMAPMVALVLFAMRNSTRHEIRVGDPDANIDAIAESWKRDPRKT